MWERLNDARFTVGTPGRMNVTLDAELLGEIVRDAIRQAQWEQRPYDVEHLDQFAGEIEDSLL